MKRSYLSLALVLFAAPVLISQAPASQTASSAPQPVYVYLYSRVTDHVNLDISEDRLRRLLPMIERYRKEHPEEHVSATILFTGAISQALEADNAKTHIKDFILDYKKRGVIEIGYDGTDEPTYEHRPTVNLLDERDPSSRWLKRAAADQKFLTEARDPITGTPIPGAVGGLEEEQKVFGEAATIRNPSVGELLPPPPPVTRADRAGVSSSSAGSAVRPMPLPAPPPNPMPTVAPEVGEWEIAPILRQYNTSAVLFGLPEANPAQIPGFKSSVWGVGRMLSPDPDTAPEVYWSDNLLHTSEWAGGVKPVVRTLHGYEGADALKDFAGKIDHSKIHVVHMELGSEQDYFKPDFAKSGATPSLIYAYSHRDSPKAPAEARLSADEVNAAFAKEEGSLKWLTAEYLPSVPGSRVISGSELKRMTPPSVGFSVSIPALKTALADLLTKWGTDTYPPNFWLADGHYLSMANMFQVMADALAEMDRTGKLPQSVKVTTLYGPITMTQSHGPNIGDVSVASIAKTCSEIDARLHDETANPMPMNTVPAVVVVDGIQMNPAQFLRLMAQALVTPSPDTKLRVRMTYMYTPADQAFPKSRPLEDMGATWTFKPAPLNAHLLSTQGSR